MNIRERLNRKPIKLLALLLTSMLIATTSAAVYYSLTMTSTVTIGATYVKFVEGTDASKAGVTISTDGKIATIASLAAYPNATTTYLDPIKVNNTHASSSYYIRLRSVSITGNYSNFSYINFTLQSSTLISLNYTGGASWSIDPSDGDTDWIELPANTGYSIVIETRATDTATSGSATIVIAVDVSDTQP